MCIGEVNAKLQKGYDLKLSKITFTVPVYKIFARFLKGQFIHEICQNGDGHFPPAAPLGQNFLCGIYTHICQEHIQNPKKYLGWSFFTKIGSRFQQLTIFSKTFIIAVWQGFEYASGYPCKFYLWKELIMVNIEKVRPQYHIISLERNNISFFRIFTLHSYQLKNCLSRPLPSRFFSLEVILNLSQDLFETLLNRASPIQG